MKKAKDFCFKWLRDSPVGVNAEKLSAECAFMFLRILEIFAYKLCHEWTAYPSFVCQVKCEYLLILSGFTLVKPVGADGVGFKDGKERLVACCHEVAREPDFLWINADGKKKRVDAAAFGARLAPAA